MSAIIGIKKSTGHATCALCKCKIYKGIEMITFTGWNCSARVHSNSKDCNCSFRK